MYLLIQVVKSDLYQITDEVPCSIAIPSIVEVYSTDYFEHVSLVLSMHVS